MTIEFAAQGDARDVEEGKTLAPKFGPDGLIPAVAADAESGTVLMMAWMDAPALAATIETGEAHYYSRSRKAMWRKGESSGHVQRVREIRLDCDQDTVLLLVEQVGPGACHVGYQTCFYRKVVRVDDGVALEVTGDKAYDPHAVYGEP
ncbi:MAG: phosphoribosyl-AMP cyclohydrolase [Alphaproteobacteria bacterium]|nr:phosphoribosyl-AMP cyclohydrolase [Alphaproteobacteria bacterium]